MTKPDDDDEVRPLFASLDEMCAAFSFDDATKEQIRRDMGLTAPREPGDTVH